MAVTVERGIEVLINPNRVTNVSPDTKYSDFTSTEMMVVAQKRQIAINRGLCSASVKSLIPSRMMRYTDKPAPMAQSARAKMQNATLRVLWRKGKPLPLFFV